MPRFCIHVDLIHEEQSQENAKSMDSYSQHLLIHFCPLVLKKSILMLYQDPAEKATFIIMS